jgi:hypothetical protein
MSAMATSCAVSLEQTTAAPLVMDRVKSAAEALAAGLTLKRPT